MPEEVKQYNIEHASWRIRVEHGIRNLKRFKIIGSVYRAPVLQAAPGHVNPHQRLHHILTVIFFLVAYEGIHFPLHRVYAPQPQRAADEAPPLPPPHPPAAAAGPVQDAVPAAQAADDFFGATRAEMNAQVAYLRSLYG